MSLTFREQAAIAFYAHPSETYTADDAVEAAQFLADAFCKKNQCEEPGFDLCCPRCGRKRES
jgi:hypothetical protein